MANIFKDQDTFPPCHAFKRDEIQSCALQFRCVAHDGWLCWLYVPMISLDRSVNALHCSSPCPFIAGSSGSRPTLTSPRARRLRRRAERVAYCHLRTSSQNFAMSLQKHKDFRRRNAFRNRAFTMRWPEAEDVYGIVSGIVLSFSSSYWGTVVRLTSFAWGRFVYVSSRQWLSSSCRWGPLQV